MYSRIKPILCADFMNGNGSLKNLERWRAEHDWLLRADLLVDWISELQDEYERTLKEDR